jgi:hypothetical protein
MYIYTRKNTLARVHTHTRAHTRARARAHTHTHTHTGITSSFVLSSPAHNTFCTPPPVGPPYPQALLEHMVQMELGDAGGESVCVGNQKQQELDLASKTLGGEQVAGAQRELEEMEMRSVEFPTIPLNTTGTLK